MSNTIQTKKSKLTMSQAQTALNNWNWMSKRWNWSLMSRLTLGITSIPFCRHLKPKKSTTTTNK